MKKAFAALFAVMMIAAVVGVAVAAATSTPHVEALSQTNIKITNSSLSFSFQRFKTAHLTLDNDSFIIPREYLYDFKELIVDGRRFDACYRQDGKR